MSRGVVVATLRDEGAAEVARAALAEAGIPVELGRAALDPFWGTVKGIAIELRVPAEREAEATAVLARASAEAEEALAEASPDELGPADEEVARVLREAGPPPRRKSPALGAVYALLVPVLGPVYAGDPLLAIGSLLVHLPILYQLLHPGAAGYELAVAAWAVGRLYDVAVTWHRIRRHNALFVAEDDSPPAEEPHGAHP